MPDAAFVRVALAVFCAVQGVATLAIDLNRTHATNPLWPGHARFHLVWQTANSALLALLEVILLLATGPAEELRFYLAAILAGVPMIGFLMCLGTMNRFDGALSDPNGIRPLRLRVSGLNLRVDLNLVVVLAGLLVLATLIALYRG